MISRGLGGRRKKTLGVGWEEEEDAGGWDGREKKTLGMMWEEEADTGGEVGGGRRHCFQPIHTIHLL